MRERPRAGSGKRLQESFIAEIRKYYRCLPAEWVGQMFAASPDWERLRELHQKIRWVEQRAGWLLE